MSCLVLSLSTMSIYFIIKIICSRNLLNDVMGKLLSCTSLRGHHSDGYSSVKTFQYERYQIRSLLARACVKKKKTSYLARP